MAHQKGTLKGVKCGLRVAWSLGQREMGSGGQVPGGYRKRRGSESEAWECESRWDLPWGISGCVGGEGSFHDKKPREDLGWGKTKEPQAEVKRKGRKISSQRERRPLLQQTLFISPAS